MIKIKHTAVISLGGSIIVPDKIQIKFLKSFKEFILKFLKKDYRFIIVTGGGSVARNYIEAASEITKISDEDKDWLGIHATRINAHLIRTIFKKESYPVVLDDAFKKIGDEKHRIFIASGWRPGWSTDYDAVLLAKRFKADKVINCSNIDYVYNKDIAKYKDAKIIKDITWAEYRKIIGSKWKPGMRAPFDPIASKMAEKLKITVIITKGADLQNLKNILENKASKGTIIRP